MQYLINYVTDNYIQLDIQNVKDLFQDKERNQDTIIKSQLPLVYKLANSYSITTPITIEELFSIGLEALLDASQRFDNSNGASFTSYASKVITSHYSNHIHSNRLIPIPHSKSEAIKPVAFTFSQLTKDDENESFISTTLSNNIDLNYSYLSNEDVLIQLIEDTLNNPKWASIVVEVLGIGMFKKKKQIEIAEENNTTKQNIGQMYNKAINRLKNNKAFKNKIRGLYNLD
ncbi:hypothetical protein BA195_10090 [Tenacibaculum soleae]|uniref:RNA polymerase sigma-70 region 2 domain-containing protein n=1 Tax=Tenacibaculum soleae TaxID=447689 RepID=A0A1B9XYE1_9FLAO|nr:sigma-70 family RNA polymerase sigma factor [Tenacibaculum soleae]OCK42516.1 hypothetical protein BA195_10090 [Tenacibaculum soleae]